MAELVRHWEIISKESLENLIAGEAKDIDGTESISSKTFLDIDKNYRPPASWPES